MIEFTERPEYQKLLNKARCEIGIQPHEETREGMLKALLRLNDKIKELDKKVEAIIRLNDLRQHG